MQQVTTLLRFVGYNVASVCMGLKIWPVSNYMQQVPTLLWFLANGCNTFGPKMLQGCSQRGGGRGPGPPLSVPPQYNTSTRSEHFSIKITLPPPPPRENPGYAPVLCVVGQQCCVRLHRPLGLSIQMIAACWLRYCDCCSLCEWNGLHGAGQIQCTEYLSAYVVIRLLSHILWWALPNPCMIVLSQLGCRMPSSPAICQVFCWLSFLLPVPASSDGNWSMLPVLCKPALSQ